MEPGEKAEDLVTVGLWYTDAVVLDPKSDVAVVVFSPDSDRRAFSGRDELNGVADEVGDSLDQEPLVAAYGKQGLHDRDFGVGSFNVRVFLEDFGDNVSEFHAVQLEGTVARPGVGEHVVDKALESDAALEQFVEDSLRFGRKFVAVIVAQDFRKGANSA